MTPPPPPFPGSKRTAGATGGADPRRVWMTVLAVAAVVAVAAAVLVVVRRGNDGGAGAPNRVQVNGGPGTTDSGPRRGGDLTLGVTNDYSTPFSAGLALDRMRFDDPVVGALYDRLLERAKDGSLLPGLARSWTNSPDLRIWTLKLRDDVRFSDGARFDAAVVVDHFERITGRLGDFAQALFGLKATALDPTTIVVTLLTPDAFFASKLAGTAGLIYRPQAAPSNGGDGPFPFGTGPFTLTSTSPIVLEKTPNYWKRDDQGQRLPYLDRVVVQPVENATVGLGKIRSGSLDMVVTGGPIDSLSPGGDSDGVAEAQSDDRFQVGTAPSRLQILSLNHRKPPFDDPQARELASLSIDRDRLSREVYRGVLPSALSLLPTESSVPLGTRWPSYSGVEADKLAERLRSAGVSTTFEVTCPPVSVTKQLDGLIQRQANLGADFRFRFFDGGEVVNKIFGSDHDWQAGCIILDLSPDPGGYYNAFHTGGSYNPTGYSNPGVDRALEAIQQTTDRNEQNRLIAVVQDQLAKDVVFIPLIFDVVAEVSSSAIGPAPDPDPFIPLPLASIYRKRR